MKTLFIGSTWRGYLTLKAMLESGIEVTGIISLAQDAHEANRCEALIRQLAMDRGIRLHETRAVSGAQWTAWQEAGPKADVAFAVGIRVLLPETFFNAFPQGCWAVHDSLLPQYRGFAPLNWAIINGEAETGVTLFKVGPEMDAGDILLQQSIPIGANETAPEVYERVCAASAELVLRGHEALRSGTATLRTQDHGAATFTCSRTPTDGLIDWTASSQTIYNLIRALTFPYPGAFTYQANRRLTILSAHIVENAARYVGRIPGRVVKIHPGGEVDVLTGDGALRILEVSSDGSTRQKATEVIRSVRARLGVDPASIMEHLHTQQESANAK